MCVSRLAQPQGPSWGYAGGSFLEPPLSSAEHCPSLQGTPSSEMLIPALQLRFWETAGWATPVFRVL